MTNSENVLTNNINIDDDDYQEVSENFSALRNNKNENAGVTKINLEEV